MIAVMEEAPTQNRGSGRPRKSIVFPDCSQEKENTPPLPVWSDEDRLLTLSEVADLLRVRPKTVHYNKSQHPERVPPWIRLPGFRSPLWRLKDVRAWIEQGVAGGEKERARIEDMRKEGLYPFPKVRKKSEFQKSTPSSVGENRDSKTIRKAGRPTKREQRKMTAEES